MPTLYPISLAQPPAATPTLPSATVGGSTALIADLTTQLGLTALSIASASESTTGSVTRAWTVTAPDGSSETAQIITAGSTTATPTWAAFSASTTTSRAGQWVITYSITDDVGTTVYTRRLQVGRKGWILHYSLDWTAEASFDIKTNGAWTDSLGVVWTPNDVSRASAWSVTNGTGHILTTNTTLGVNLSTAPGNLIPSYSLADKVAFVAERRGNDGVASDSRTVLYSNTGNTAQAGAGVAGASEDTHALSKTGATTTPYSVAHGGTEKVQHGVAILTPRAEHYHSAGVTWPPCPADMTLTKVSSQDRTVTASSAYNASTDTVRLAASGASGNTDVVKKFAAWRYGY